MHGLLGAQNNSPEDHLKFTRQKPHNHGIVAKHSRSCAADLYPDSRTINTQIVHIGTHLRPPCGYGGFPQGCLYHTEAQKTQTHKVA